MNDETPAQPLNDHLGLFELPNQDRTWVAAAACRGSGANFFPMKMGEIGIKEALAACEICPVQIDCLKYALDNRIQYGIWGGYTARGRRELANALEYLRNTTRVEHITRRWHAHYEQIGDPTPLERTALTLGVSKATVYHHLRIDKLAREKTHGLLETQHNDSAHDSQLSA